MCLLKDKQRKTTQKISKKLRWNFFGDFFSAWFFCCFLLQPFAVFVFLILLIFFYIFYLPMRFVFSYVSSRNNKKKHSLLAVKDVKRILLWFEIFGRVFLCVFFACECYWCLRKVCFSYNKWVKKQRKGFIWRLGVSMLSYGK